MAFLFSALIFFVPEAPETHIMDVRAATFAIMMKMEVPYVWDVGDYRLSTLFLLSRQAVSAGMESLLFAFRSREGVGSFSANRFDITILTLLQNWKHE